ncbi:hypothetical protein ISF12_10270 [Pseudomonas aeruginosa]|nr:hypothetical protein [Pseudomonas aeruginosa]
MRLQAFSFGLLALSVVAVADEPTEQPKEPIEARADSVLQASPEAVLRIRGKLQKFATAKNAPIQADYEQDIPQDTLDLEEIFDVTLEPDSPPPKIFISKYQSSAVSFIDAYGNPWPIRSTSSFMGDQIEILKAIPSDETRDDSDKKGEKKSSNPSINDPQAGSFTVTALKQGVVGNMTVYLYNNPTPVTILLVAKPAMYHRQATIRIGDVGPQTNTGDMYKNTGVVLGTPTDMDLNHALYGVSPDGTEQMVVEGGEGQAWLKGDFLYLRTPLAVFSPEILGASPGNGRYRAYKLVKTTTVMATNTEGSTVKLKIMRHPATEIYNQTTFKR